MVHLVSRRTLSKPPHRPTGACTAPVGADASVTPRNQPLSPRGPCSRLRRRSPFVSAALLLTLGGPVAAQAPPEAQPSPLDATQSAEAERPADTGQEGAPTSTPGTPLAADAARSATSPGPSPPPAPGADPRDPFIPVDDPMLAPVPAADNIIDKWQDALARIRSQSPDLLRAHYQVEVARGRARQALSRSLPTLTATGNANLHILQGTGFNINTLMDGPIPDPRGNLSANINLRVPLISVRNWYDHGTAKRQIQQAQLQADDRERLVVGGLAESILSVVTAERLAEVTRVNLASALSSLELNKRRARLGAANAVDVLRAEQQVATMRAQVIQSDETLRQARESLGIALGDSGAWGVTPDIKMDQLRADARATCSPNDDVEARPDMLAAKKGEEIARRNSRSVDYSYLPTLEAQSQLQGNTIPQATATRDGSQWTIGAVLSWNLYDGGQRYGEKTTNHALYESARVDVADARRRANLEVTQSLRSVQVAESRLSVAQKSYEIAAQNSRLARIRFVNGTGSSFDMIQTQGAAQEAGIDVTVKEFELLRAQIMAYLALASCDI